MLSPAVQGMHAPRKERLAKALSEMFGVLLGRAGDLDFSASIIDLGGDSLFLLQAAAAIREKFSIRIPFRLLLEDLSSIDRLAIHLDGKLPPEQTSDVASAPPAASVPTDTAGPAIKSPRHTAPESNGSLTAQFAIARQIESSRANGASFGDADPIYEIFNQQLMLMKQQIAILTAQQGGNGSRSTQSVNEAAVCLEPAETRVMGAPAHNDHLEQPAKIEPEVFIPFRALQTKSGDALSELQQEHLQSLIRRLNDRTPGSKRIAQQGRQYLADNRAVAGFRSAWKEMFYPLMVARGQGSHIWDVDGNEFIDMTMGFGALLFGHSPPFIVDTLGRELSNGLRLGGHSREAFEAAQLICEMTGVERVLFCNSGTEAVMAALRLARTVTGRSRIALFEGCYHGTFDGVLVKGLRGADSGLRCVPVAPGIPEHMVSNVLMLKYDDPESLEILKANAGELAAVLIEPPRSRRPDVQPREFLLALRRITEASGVAFIFDEVVTGFRFHPGGAQAMFGIRADLVTYGKALAGGLPIAAVAGKAKFMDAVDGGTWQYGDNSYPEAEITFITGTYFKHPLIMPAVVATLRHLKERGSQLQESINAKAKYVSDELGEFLKERSLPLRVAQFGSLFRFLHAPGLRFIDLLYYHLLDKGFYVCETRNLLLSTAHTDADLQAFIRASKESLIELQEAGFLSGRVETPRAMGTSSQVESAPEAMVRAPLTEAQRQIWAASHMEDGGASTYNLPLVLQWKGVLNVDILARCVNTILERHEGFRATFSAEGDYQLICPLTIEVPLVDLQGLSGTQLEIEIQAWRHSEATRIFNFVSGPLLSAKLLRLQEDLHLLLLTMHHIVSDGWSLGMYLRELTELYSAAVAGTSPQLTQPRSFVDYARTTVELESKLSGSEAEKFWVSEFPDSIVPQPLPPDVPSGAFTGATGAQRRVTMSSAVTHTLADIGRKYTCTRFMVMLAVCKIFVYYLTEQEDVVIGVPSAGQNQPDCGYVAGCCVNLLAIGTRMSMDMTFPELLSHSRRRLMQAYEHSTYPFSRLMNRLRVLHPEKPEPGVSVIFNLDRSQGVRKHHQFEIEVLNNHNGTAKFDLTIDLTETPDNLIIEFEYKSQMFTAERVAEWMELFQRLIRVVAERPLATVREYFEALTEFEAHRTMSAMQELKRQEQSRFAASKRKVVAVG